MNNQKSNIDLLAELQDQDKNQIKKSHADKLIELCTGIELFHCPNKKTYATIHINSHLETYSLRSNDFKMWLLKAYYDENKSAPGDNALKMAIQTLEAKALHEGFTQDVYLRVSHQKDIVYLDLLDESWRVIKITSSGWEVLDNSPVKFIREPGMLPLPIPQKSYLPKFSIEDLKDFLNVSTSDDFKLLIAWVLQAIGITGPYLILVLYGEQGTSKSTSVRILRSFIDPNNSPVRRPPKNSDDLIASANSNYVVAIDNISKLSNELSDNLCVLSTGAGFAKRKLYTDAEEHIIKVKRPITINGIDEFVARGDLASRSIIINLPVIPKCERKPEKNLWEELDQKYSYLFEIILTAVSEGLKNLNSIELDEYPRMADAWKFITAAETGLGWKRGSCLKAFQDNQKNANEVVLNSSILYPFVKEMADSFFEGTAQELLDRLKSYSSNMDFSEKRYFPKNGSTLSGQLRRLSPSFRETGEINIEFVQTSGSNSKKIIKISWINNNSVACDAFPIPIPKPPGY